MSNASNEPIPPCAVTIDDRHAIVRPDRLGDTVAELCRTAGLDVAAGLWIDGRWTPPSTRLVDSGLRVGSTVTSIGPEPSGRDTGSVVEVGPVVEVAVVAGVSCAPWRPLATGRHGIGRAPLNDLHVDDLDVELHHGVLDVGRAAMTFTQLTGRVPTRLDGELCEPVQTIEPTSSLQIGASRVEFRMVADRAPSDSTAGRIVDSHGDPWRVVVHRGPRAPSSTAPVAIVVPESPTEHRGPPIVGLVGAGIAALGAGVMAVIFGQVMFALFAAIGAVVGLATWSVGAIGALRARRRTAADHRRQCEEFVHALRRAHLEADRLHRRDHRPISELLDPTAWDRRVWERRLVDGSVVNVTIGLGTCRWRAPIDAESRRHLQPELLVELERCELLADVAVPLDLVPGEVIAIAGELGVARALARSIIVQAATVYGPADWRLVVVTLQPDEWSWADWLPHSADGSSPVVGGAECLADMIVADGTSLLVVTDVPELLAVRTGRLRRFLDTSGAACIVVNRPGVTLPALCTRVLDIGANGIGHWRSSDDLDAMGIQLTGISRSTAESVARRLAPLIDPEDSSGGPTGVPREVRLGELIDTSEPAVIAERWIGGGADPSLCVTIGRSGDGAVEIDLVRDGPHGLIAGTTGAGKSELLRTLVVSLAAAVSPDHLGFVLIDFKGGSTFDACARLPHTVGVVTDLDEGLAQRALVSLDAEIRRRERLLRTAHADDLTVYRRNATDPLARLVVVVDEFATLAKELPEFLTALVGIAQRGRSLGIHLLLATQRPGGVVTDDIRANMNLRLALRVHDRSDATDVVGDELPSTFPRGLPGRAALRLGPHELVVFQTASCTGPARRGSMGVRVDWRDAPRRPELAATSELGVLVDSIRAAAASTGVREPHRPWLDPLPHELAPSDLGETDRQAVGLVDDPAHQRRRPLRWDSGHLLLVGSIGSGTTTTALTVAGARLRDRGPGEIELYAIDGIGTPALDALVDVAACGGVVRTTEHERLDRLLCRLADQLDRRTHDGSRSPEVVVIVDGLGAVRTALSTIERAEAAARFDRVLQEGPGVGIVLIATTDGSSVSMVSMPAGQRWVFHVDDVAIARTAGLRSPPPPAIAGRVAVVESGLGAQVVFDSEPMRGLSRSSVGPVPIEVLASTIDPDELLVHDDDNGDGLVLGRCADDLGPAVLRVPPGDHVFIGGSAGTGKSTALRQLAAAWCRRNPLGIVMCVDRHDPLDTIDLDRPTLIVVDDADRIDDVDGRLAAIIAGRAPGVTIVAAARLETVRVAYGHWVREITRSRCGLIMTSVGEVDGELLGVALPRRSVIAPRPGLGWLIDAHGHRLVQVAARMPS